MARAPNNQAVFSLFRIGNNFLFTHNNMKHIITIALVSTSLSVYAQEAPQAQRTQGQHDVTEIAKDKSAQQEKVEVPPSELPAEIMNSFEQSEYSDMDIVIAYKVHENDASAQDLSNTPLTYDADSSTETDTQEMTNDAETPEEIEETGNVIAAEAPEAENSDDAITEEEKELYERNQYNKYTEANSDAYADIAQEKTQGSETATKYELQVTSGNQKKTLIYDEEGKLLETNEGSM